MEKIVNNSLDTLSTEECNLINGGAIPVWPVIYLAGRFLDGLLKAGSDYYNPSPSYIASLNKYHQR